jgi:hypothetical protein
VVTETIPLCKKCTAPIEEGLRRQPMRLCQGCIDVAVHKLLFPSLDNRTDLAGVTQIP